MQIGNRVETQQQHQQLYSKVSYEQKLCLRCIRCAYLTHCSDAPGLAGGRLSRCSVLASTNCSVHCGCVQRVQCSMTTDDLSGVFTATLFNLNPLRMKTCTQVA